jgi:F-type H+-transporting ATPase subunit b
MNLTATLFGQIISFAILVWFVNRVLWRPLTEAMAKRTQRIEEGLRAAERAKLQEQLASKEAAKVLKQARSKAADIIQQAQQRRAAIFESTLGEAQEIKARMIASAEEEVERMVDRAREQLRRELAGLVLEGAGRVALAEMDAGRHEALLDDLMARF